jgi:hypothetical protein
VYFWSVSLSLSLALFHLLSMARRSPALVFSFAVGVQVCTAIRTTPHRRGTSISRCSAPSSKEKVTLGKAGSIRCVVNAAVYPGTFVSSSAKCASNTEVAQA